MKRLTFLAGIFSPLFPFAPCRKPESAITFSDNAVGVSAILTTGKTPYFVSIFDPYGRHLAKIEATDPTTVLLQNGTMEETVTALAALLLRTQDREGKHPECQTLADWFEAFKRDNEQFEQRLKQRENKEREKGGA